MNILARILSHGFAIAVVVLLAIGFIYRGELFPDLEMPAFLARDADTGTDNVEPSTAAPEQPVPPAPASEPAVEAPVVAAGTAPGATGVEEPADTVVMQQDEEESPAGEVVIEEVAAEAPRMASAVEAPGPTVTMEPVRDLEAGVVPAPETAGAGTEPAEEAMPPAGEAASPGAVEVEVVEETMVEEAPVMEAEPAPAVGETTGVPGTGPAADVPLEGDMAAGVPSAQEAARVAAEPSVDEPAQVVTDETGTLVIETHVISEAAAPAVTVTETSPYKLLAAAREAYWLHDYAMAEANYRKLAEVEPDNPDGYGELGNMYFSQGKWEEASSAYFEAGVRLVRAGQIQPARDLLNIIRGLNGAQAEELENLISAAGQPESQ